MQTDNRLLDDLTRVAGGAMGALSGIKSEVEAMVRQQFERILADMDMVPREEFEAVKAVAAKARMEQEKLEKRVAQLESALAELRTAKPATAKAAAAKPKAAPRRTSVKRTPGSKAPGTRPVKGG